MFSERWAIIRYSCKAVMPQMLSLVPRPPVFSLFGLHFTRIQSGRTCISVNINQGIKLEGPGGTRLTMLLHLAKSARPRLLVYMYNVRLGRDSLSQ